MNEPAAADCTEELFHEALEHSPVGERARFLELACHGDEGLREKVERLLAAHLENSEDFLENGLRAGPIRIEIEKPGESIGTYRLLAQIGEGGFGTVWKAEQRAPVRRTVALKIIKLGMDTREVIARFEQERQALAILTHPNIARVFDAGATATGRPFFAMELVEGVRITEFCDAAKLATPERLRLFVQVCHAVQHAHQKGIIHRDLKPSNILVAEPDGIALPKIIDFGIAKATQEKLTEFTLITRETQLIGTPHYLSPEQAALGTVDIDTRSDIYSLGVLLYELLTGQLPFAHLIGAPAHDLRRAILEEEPPLPSTMLSGMSPERLLPSAELRGCEPPKLIGAICGDLDWIVMRALEKERDRRYQTAAAFAEDIERHLACKPVQARPPSNVYRFLTFARRNKVTLAAAAAVLLALISGAAVSTWQAVRAKATLAELRGTAPAFAEQARGLAAMSRFDEAIEKLGYALKLQPTSAEYLVAQGDLQQCQLQLQEAAITYRAALARAPEHARAKANLALCERLLSSPGADGKLPREALAELLAWMADEQRPAAQLMRVGQLLGEEKKLARAYWLERLKDLPISPENPLSQRLTVLPDGLLALDLSQTSVADLGPLAGMPLGKLDCTGCVRVTELEPLRGMLLHSLRLGGSGIYHLTPLEQLRALEELDISTTKVVDLAPVLGLPLRILKLEQTEINDLSPLREMLLEELGISQTRVSDLTPLAGMRLRRLDLDGTPVLNFTPLAGMPLESLSLRFSRPYDLSFVREMPLRELYLSGATTHTIGIVAEIRTLETLVLPEYLRVWPDAELDPIVALRSHPTLRQLGAQVVRGPRFDVLQSTEQFWRDWDREAAVFKSLEGTDAKARVERLADETWAVSLLDQPVSDLSFLHGAPISELELTNSKITDLSPLKGMRLKVLNVNRTNVTDLRPVAGMPLEQLSVTRTKISDLVALEGLPLKTLEIEEIAIADLSPLRGMKLEQLWIGNTQVSDLSPLSGMPIRVLQIDSCPNLSDVSPLMDIPTLKEVLLPRTARNFHLLRDHPGLKYISFDLDRTRNRPAQTATEFWSTTAPAEEVAYAQKQNFYSLAVLLAPHVERQESSEPSKDCLKLAAVELARKSGAYRRTCAQTCSWLRRADPAITLLVCSLGPDSGIERTELQKLLEAAAEPRDTLHTRQWALLACALAEYRLGRPEAALQLAELVGPFESTGACAAAAAAIRAMVAHHQNRSREAVAILDGYAENVRSHWPSGDPERWQHWLVAYLLTGEARELLGESVSPQAAK